MKYIIIPVKTITDNLENHEYNMDLECMLVDYPQISLDEKDIEEKAKEHAQSILKFHSTTLEGYKLRGKNSYQQALLDIKITYNEK